MIIKSVLQSSTIILINIWIWFLGKGALISIAVPQNAKEIDQLQSSKLRILPQGCSMNAFMIVVFRAFSVSYRNFILIYNKLSISDNSDVVFLIFLFLLFIWLRVRKTHSSVFYCFTRLYWKSSKRKSSSIHRGRHRSKSKTLTSNTPKTRPNHASSKNSPNCWNRFWHFSEFLVLQVIRFTKLLDLIHAFWVYCNFCAMNVYSFNVVLELHWTVNLNFFVSCDDPCWLDLLCFCSVECRVDFLVRKLV